MPDESTAPDLVELQSRFLEAANRRDLDATLSFYAPDAVWKTVGLGTTFEGVAAIRGFLDDWLASYEELRVEQEEAVDLGNGVVYGVLRTSGRLVGSSGEVRHRNAAVALWVEGLIERVTHYPDLDQARAAAERLAEERGQAVSEDSLLSDAEVWREWVEASSFEEWAAFAERYYAPEVVWESDLAVVEGRSAVLAVIKEYWAMWDEHHHYLDEYLNFGHGVTYSIIREDARMRGSDSQVDAVQGWVGLWEDGRIVRARSYTDIDEARAAAERLAEERAQADV